MPMTELKILLVDDDPILLEMHSAFLEKNNFSVLIAEDGEKALAMLEIYYENIGVVVSDVRMPNMDGYELCQKMQEGQKIKDIPVIFVSALTSLEEKMKGYEIGADDYITKPVNEDELSRKIYVLLEMYEQQKVINKKATESENMAMEAITLSNELALVVEFYDKLMTAKSIESIGECFFETISKFGLIAILQIYLPDEKLDLSVSGIVTPLESNVIELARNNGRFYDFGARTIVNYNSFSFLIKNMPLGDNAKHKRLKDILEMLGNGMEAKHTQLIGERGTQDADSVCRAVNDSISNIESCFSDIKSQSISSIVNMNSKLDVVLKDIGVTDSQIKNIHHLTNGCLERTKEAFGKGDHIGESLKNIGDNLHQITGIILKK